MSDTNLQVGLLISAKETASAAVSQVTRSMQDLAKSAFAPAEPLKVLEGELTNLSRIQSEVSGLLDKAFDPAKLAAAKENLSRLRTELESTSDPAKITSLRTELLGLQESLKTLGSTGSVPVTALGGALSRLRSELGSIARTAAGVAVGGLVAQLSMGLSGAVEKSISGVKDLGLETAKLTRETGLSSEAASGLLTVFERYGMGVMNASTSLGIFSKHLAGITDLQDAGIVGGKSFNAVMQGLGVSFQDASGNALPMNDVLLAVADKFKAMPDGVEKTADAMLMFGRSGKDMIPILDLGKEGLQEAMDTASRYGMTLSGDNVKSILQFNLAQKEMGEATGGLTIKLGTMLMPALTSLTKGGVEAAEAFNDRVAPALSATGAVIKPLTDFMGKHKEVQAALVGILGLVATGYTVATAAEAAHAVVTKSLSVATGALTAAQWLLNAAMSANPIGIVITLFAGLAAAVIYMWNTNEGFRTAVTAAWDVILAAGRAMTQAIGDAFGAMGKVIGDTWNGVTLAAKNAINAIIGFLDKLISAWNGIHFQIPHIDVDLGPAGHISVGGQDFGVPQLAIIPALAAGGPVTAGMPYLVGERGPELFVPSASGTVIPNGGGIDYDRLGQTLAKYGGRQITLNSTVHSPVPMSPADIRRQTEKALRSLALEYGLS